MEYFTIVIQKMADDTIANAIYTYDTEDEALEKLYSEMAYATSVKALKSISVMVMTENCYIGKCEKWVNKALVEETAENH